MQIFFNQIAIYCENRLKILCDIQGFKLPTLLSQEATESCTHHKEEENQKGILGSRAANSGEMESLLLKRNPRVILALESSRTAISDEANGGDLERSFYEDKIVCEYSERFVQLRQFELN